MHVWFYAPMKPPTHVVPSGDRRMARLLMRAFEEGGHDVVLASTLRAYDGAGDPQYQDAIARRAEGIAARLIDKARRDPPPDIWFTYHLYHKAPDWLGPMVSEALGIPYLVAEVSRAPKRAEGPWAMAYAQCERALHRVDTVISLNPEDDVCVAPALRPGVPIVPLSPFLDPKPFDIARGQAATSRAHLATRYGLNADTPWLCAAAMMRAGDKAASYALLAKAIETIDAPLLIAGDGSERPAVEAMFRNRAAQTVFLGALEEADLAALFAASDIMVWPAVNEAFGMALLEAQASGCPVVAASTGGVPGVVAHGESGILTPIGDAKAFSDAVRWLLDNRFLRRQLSRNAVQSVARRHTIAAAAAILRSTLATARTA